SVGDLPASAPIGLYLDTPCDALLPVETVEGQLVDVPFSRRKIVKFSSWDPTDLTWDSVRDAVRATAETRDTLQAAVASEDDEAIEDAILHHSHQLARVIVPSRRKHSSIIVKPLMVLIGGIAAIVHSDPEYAFKSVELASAEEGVE